MDKYKTLKYNTILGQSAYGYTRTKNFERVLEHPGSIIVLLFASAAGLY